MSRYQWWILVKFLKVGDSESADFLCVVIEQKFPLRTDGTIRLPPSSINS